jgi:hypothetical protein
MESREKIQEVIPCLRHLKIERPAVIAFFLTVLLRLSFAVEAGFDGFRNIGSRKPQCFQPLHAHGLGGAEFLSENLDAILFHHPAEGFVLGFGDVGWPAFEVGDE